MSSSNPKGVLGENATLGGYGLMEKKLQVAEQKRIFRLNSDVFFLRAGEKLWRIAR